MKVSLERRAFSQAVADLIVILVSDGKIVKGGLGEAIDRALDGALSELITNDSFKGKIGTCRLVSTLGKLKARYVLLIGLGERKTLTLEGVRRAMALVPAQARAASVTEVLLEIATVPKEPLTASLAAQTEGVCLATYQFNAFKSEVSDASPELASVLFFLSAANLQKSAKPAELESALRTAEILSRATMFARDLVNTPPRDMTPRALAKAAQGMRGVRTTLYSKAEALRLKMNAYLSVAMGSNEPPVFVEMIYQPQKKAKTVLAIVGKGVTFDSGGLSLKPAKSMETMKCDMAGAAAVIAFMRALSELKPEGIEVRGYVAATENMPDGASQRPGDVIRAMNGKTIEVLNTDAEGRLTLADALHFANTRKVKPDYIVDMATLTGACLVALGERVSGLMGTDQGLIDKLKRASERSGEALWQLPLVDDYMDDIKSPVADLQNSGGRYAGTITAGLFLKAFVGDAKWAHLDIAGPAWTDRALPYTPRGGTGVMVRTLWELLKTL